LPEFRQVVGHSGRQEIQRLLYDCHHASEEVMKKLL